MFLRVLLVFTFSIHLESCEKDVLFPLFLVAVSFASIEMQGTFKAEVRPSLLRHSLYSCRSVWMFLMAGIYELDAGYPESPG